MDLSELLDAGLTGAAIVAVVALWRRLTALEDRLFGYLEEGRRQRHEMAAQLSALRLESDKHGEEQT